MFRRVSRVLSGESLPHRGSSISSNHFIPPSFPNTEEILSSYIALLLQKKSLPLLPKQIHAQLIVNGFEDGILATRVLGTYIISRSYDYAKKLFFRLQLRYAAPWNWMIRGFTATGHCKTAVLIYFKMMAFGTLPDKYTFPYVIKACGYLQAVPLLKYVHGMAKHFNFELDVYVGSALVKFYSDNGCLDNAREVFDRLPQRDIVLWNVMLDAYSKSGSSADDVVELFQEMRRGGVEGNSVTYSCVLSLCGSKSLLCLGRQVHGLVMRLGLDMDSAAANTLVAMYAKCRCVFEAQKTFDSISEADIVAWNAMIGGYVQNGFMNEALSFFQRMMIPTNAKPDSTTFSSLLPSVTELGCLNQGKEIHGFVVRHEIVLDLHLKNALIDMYFKCRDVQIACSLFNESPAVDVVVFTAMISGFVLNGMNSEALNFFRRMLDAKIRPNTITLASVLPACAGLAALKLGRELHGSVIRRGFEGRCYVGSAVCDMYAKCGNLDLCHSMFLRMPERDSISWNCVITNFCQNGRPEVAMDLFRLMGFEGAKYDCVTVSAALSACGSLCTLHHGKEIHGFMVRKGYQFDVFSTSARTDMYAKCGSLEWARRAFDSIESKNEVSWNSIIAAYGNHGHLSRCLEYFHGMQDRGFLPDHVTFLAILSACGHAGRVEEGRRYFEAMVRDHGIDPRMEHYACFVDMLGRAGCLEEAVRVAETMPFPPDGGIWGTILGACRMHGHAELAELASARLVELDPQNSGYYVLLSNLHADSGAWTRVDRIRELMKKKGVHKVRGESWIEVNKSVNVFAAADKSHPQGCHVYEVLHFLLKELQDEGDQIFLC